MTDISRELLAAVKSLRQSRHFLDTPVDTRDLEQLLEIARWTGSAKNTQPWHLIVVTEAAMNTALAQCGDFAGFLAGAPASIVVAMEGESRSVAYDDGRLQERVMFAAKLLGLGTGTAWFGTPEYRQRVRELLGIPGHLEPWSAIAVGHTDHSQSQTTLQLSGRKPVEEITSWGRFGGARPHGPLASDV